MNANRLFSRLGSMRTLGLAATLVLATALLLSGCGLDRSIDPWQVQASPSNVCPGDSVTLNWNTHDGGCLGDGCPPPVTMSIASDPADVLGSFSGLGYGSTTAGPINSYTTFTFSPSGGSRSRSPRTLNVRVILPEVDNIVPVSSSAYCNGSAATFNQIDLSIPIFRSEGVRVTDICKVSSDIVTLTLTFENGAVQRYPLDPCIMPDGLSPELGSTVVKATLSTTRLSLTRCEASSVAPGSSSGLPAPLTVNVHLICDLGMGGSASAPIVAATAGSTPTSDLVTIYTDTPEPKPTVSLNKNAFCRKGPGTIYPDVTAFEAGQQLQVDGQNDFSPRWWWVHVPNSQTHCWISDAAVQTSGPVEGVPVQPAPPTPTFTPPPNSGPACSQITSDKQCNNTPGCAFDYNAKTCVKK
jgi:hypothetical protein